MITLDSLTLPPAAFNIFAVFSFSFGACIGSFLNVCIWRLPRGESIVRPGSHCPKCNAAIPWYCNIPILSWLALRGRCKDCGQPISPRYMVVEALTGLLFLAVFCAFESTDLLLVPVYWLVLAMAVYASFVDIDHYILPDAATVGGIVAGPVLSWILPQLQGCTARLDALFASLLGAGVGFGTLWLVGVLGKLAFRKEAMGFGDVKLMGAVGALFGWQAALFTIFASSFLGAFWGLVMIAFGSAKMKSRIPFGPYLCAGMTLWMFYGPPLVNWYLSLLRHGGI